MDRDDIRRPSRPARVRAARGRRRPRPIGRRPGAFAAEDEALHDYVPDAQDPMRLLRRISALHTERWQDHFSSIAKDAILVKVNDRVLHYWGSDGFYRIYPTSVPLTEEMTRRGRTSVTLKRPDPDWRPTAAMLRRHPTCRPTCRRGPTTRSASARSTSAGPPTASTAPTTSARSAGSRPAAASGSSTSTSSRSTTAPRSARRSAHLTHRSGPVRAAEFAPDAVRGASRPPPEPRRAFAWRHGAPAAAHGDCAAGAPRSRAVLLI